MINYYTAVQNLVGGAMSGPNNGPIEKFQFFDKQTPPTEKAIQTKLKEMQDEYDAQEYARKREVEYPLIGDQLDMIYKDMKNGTTTHATAVEAVKTKYPKG